MGPPSAEAIKRLIVGTRSDVTDVERLLGGLRDLGQFSDLMLHISRHWSEQHPELSLASCAHGTDA